MNRTHPPTYPLRPHPEDRSDWLDVAGRVLIAGGLLLLAVLVVAVW
jgi:hypothetical protein